MHMINWFITWRKAFKERKKKAKEQYEANNRLADQHLKEMQGRFDQAMERHREITNRTRSESSSSDMRRSDENEPYRRDDNNDMSINWPTYDSGPSYDSGSSHNYGSGSDSSSSSPDYGGGSGDGGGASGSWD